MEKKEFKKVLLLENLRVVLLERKHTKAFTILALIGTGSKYEKKETNGISHFLEHLFFKGTKKMESPLKIAERLDRVGGHYNAFTAKEYTGFWAKVAKEYFLLAIDWLGDILLNSTFPTKEIEREKMVILEEIKLLKDTPTDYIGDLWEELLYKDQPAGWPIIGKKENILKFKRKDFFEYYKNHYSRENIVLVIAGNFKEEKVLKEIEKAFKKLKKKGSQKKKRVFQNQKEPEILCFFKKTDQTHLYLGTRGLDLFDKRRYQKAVLATILGGNMSSRLFSTIREKKGLAYYISTFSQLYTDSGYLVTKAGVAHNKVSEVIKLILKEYKKIKEKLISKNELEKAKNYLKGTLKLTLENLESEASFYGLQELLEKKILTPAEKIAELEKVKREDIIKLAREIFQPKNLNLALIGPFKDSKFFKKMLKLN